MCGVGVAALRRDGDEAWRGACPVYGCTAVALSARLDDAGASLPVCPVCSHKLYLVRLMSAVCACCILPCNANLCAISYDLESYVTDAYNVLFKSLYMYNVGVYNNIIHAGRSLYSV